MRICKCSITRYCCWLAFVLVKSWFTKQDLLNEESLCACSSPILSAPGVSHDFSSGFADERPVPLIESRVRRGSEATRCSWAQATDPPTTWLVRIARLASLPDLDFSCHTPTTTVPLSSARRPQTTTRHACSTLLNGLFVNYFGLDGRVMDFLRFCTIWMRSRFLQIVFVELMEVSFVQFSIFNLQKLSH